MVWPLYRKGKIKMKYGSLTKVLMNDNTVKYICMIDTNDILYNNQKIKTINKCFGKAKRIKFSGDTIIVSENITKINSIISIDTLTPDIILNHMLYDLGDVNPVIIADKKIITLT